MCLYSSITTSHLISSHIILEYSQTCIKRSPLGQRKSGLLRQVTVPLKRGSIHIKFSMTGQEKGDLSIYTGDCLIEVEAGSIVYTFANVQCQCQNI